MLCIHLKNDLIVHNDERVDFGYWNCYAVCFGNCCFYDYWLAGFAFSCETGFVSDYPVSDLWIHNVSNCFVRRFYFGYEARNEQIENPCQGKCVVFCLNTWSSADCGLLSRNNLVDGPLNYYDVGSYPVNLFGFCVCLGNCFCGVWNALCYSIHSSRTVRVRRLCQAGDCTANLVDTEVTLAGGTGIIRPLQCNEGIYFCC